MCVAESETRVGVLSLFGPLHSLRLLKARYAYKQTNAGRVRESSRDSRRQATAAAARQATTAPTTTRSPESQHVRRGGHPQNGVYIAWHILRILFALILALHSVSLAVSLSLSVCRCFCYGHGL